MKTITLFRKILPVTVLLSSTVEITPALFLLLGIKLPSGSVGTSLEEVFK